MRSLLYTVALTRLDTFGLKGDLNFSSNDVIKIGVYVPGEVLREGVCLDVIHVFGY